MKFFPQLCVIALLLGIAGCSSKQQGPPSIGDAYAGPSSLNIRQDIALQSPVVATVNHGERLEVLLRRRRFVKVRTARQVEGWTDERMLLSEQQVAGLRALSEKSKQAPSQGAATTYDTLNMHTEPDRQSPSFLQVKEGEKVDVIGRHVAPRVSVRPPSPAPAPVLKTPAKKKAAKEGKKGREIPLPPMPAVPKPPPDWVPLSQPNPTPAAAQEPPQEVPMDDWSLIRNAAGQSGWVLTRRLVMAIPDEVAQYAEGRRIAAYFSLGEVRDGTLRKPSWLWTTVERGLEPHDFDSIRVFVWSTRRHRYETGYIDRNVKGFFPVLTGPQGFSILVEKKDGLRYRRRYSFLENRVRFAGEERIEAAPAQAAPEQAPTLIASEKAGPQPEASFYSGLKERIKRLFGR